MSKLIWAVGLLLLAGGLAYHFAALEIFGALVPKDAGSRLVARDEAFGPDARQRVDVYAPSTGQGPWPVIVFVHGGSWQAGDKGPYGFVGRALAAQGMVAVVINYRLHPQDRYPAFVEDTALALRWAAENAQRFGGDGAKLFAMGHSAGAYNLTMAVLDRAYAGTVPPLAGVITLAGPFDFLPLDSPVTVEVFGGIADLPATQPINHLRADAPPFLILHGRDDTTVRLRNAESLRDAFERAGMPVTFKIYDGVSHAGIMLALSRPFRNSAPVLADAMGFIRDRLK